MKLGNINAAFQCTVFKNGIPVAICADTPNSVAYAMSVTGGDTARGPFGSYKAESMRDRVINAGWFKSVEQACVKVL